MSNLVRAFYTVFLVSDLEIFLRCILTVLGIADTYLSLRM